LTISYYENTDSNYLLLTAPNRLRILMKIVIDLTKHIFPKIMMFVLFCLVLVGVIAYARGYRFNPQEGTFTSTGIISINSNPRPAKIYINDNLQGVTDTNVTLPFGQYDVLLQKEGYTDWIKHVSLKGEIVMSLNALLFSKNPSLSPLTNIGVTRAIAVGNTDKIIIISSTGNAEKDGIYLFEPSAQPLTIFPPLKLLLLQSLLPETVDIKSAEFEFDPNYRRMIGTLKYTEPTTETETVSYLLALDQQNIELFDITSSNNDILTAWHAEKNRELAKIIETLPPGIREVASTSAYLVSLSPDEKKLMYIAKAPATLPRVIDPPLIGANQTKDTRSIESGKLYIYDKKEDRNYLIPLKNLLDVTQTSPPTNSPDLLNEKLLKTARSMILWYPTSDYVAMKVGTQIVVMQYDGENKQTVYAGPFEPDYFGISPDWNVMVVINLNPHNNAFGDVYSVGIR